MGMKLICLRIGKIDKTGIAKDFFADIEKFAAARVPIKEWSKVGTPIKDDKRFIADKQKVAKLRILTCKIRDPSEKRGLSKEVEIANMCEEAQFTGEKFNVALFMRDEQADAPNALQTDAQPARLMGAKVIFSMVQINPDTNNIQQTVTFKVEK
jgi:hypothetical protein